jgi:ribosomal protein S12 methylthiotransferase
MMYLHPSRVDDELLRLVAKEPRICPYFDMPLQHAADPILKAMHRSPLAKENRALIDRIRTIVPNSALRTTFIVGFPGETEAMFKELVHFIEDVRFEKAGVFPFSPEEDTPAFSMRPRPRNATAARRCEELMNVQREISKSIGLSRVGSTADIIIDEVVHGVHPFCQGRTQWDAPEIDGTVFIKKGMAEAGSIVPVTITSSDEYDLYGSIVL